MNNMAIQGTKMAFWNNKKEVEALSLKLKKRDEEISNLKQQLEQLSQQKESIEASLTEEQYKNQWSTALFPHIEQFGHSLTGFHDSLGLMTNTLTSEKSSAAEGAKASADIHQHVESVATGLNSITGQMAQSETQVNSLQGNAEKIGSFVEMISQISEQTNLLALNAAIEAARAGEHGRGFAVVADEVRTLATRAREASVQISDLVDNIQKETESAGSLMQAVTKDTTTFGDNVNNVVADMEKVLGFSIRMEKTISCSALRGFIEIAKLDHITWKFDIYRVMMGLSQTTPSELSNHSQCGLGKWYSEEATGNFSKLTGYRELAAPHKIFHDQGALALKSFYENDTEKTLSSLNQMEQASMDVINTLEQMLSASESTGH